MTGQAAERATREAERLAALEKAEAERRVHQITRARALIEAGEETRSGVAELFGVDVATLRRAMGKE